MIALKVRAVHGVALNMLRGHLRALGHSEELALGKVDIRVYQTFQKVVRISLPLNIFWVSIYAAYFCKKKYFLGIFLAWPPIFVCVARNTAQIEPKMH